MNNNEWFFRVIVYAFIILTTLHLLIYDFVLDKMILEMGVF